MWQLDLLSVLLIGLFIEDTGRMSSFDDLLHDLRCELWVALDRNNMVR